MLVCLHTCGFFLVLNVVTVQRGDEEEAEAG